MIGVAVGGVAVGGGVGGGVGGVGVAGRRRRFGETTVDVLVEREGPVFFAILGFVAPVYILFFIYFFKFTFGTRAKRNTNGAKKRNQPPSRPVDVAGVTDVEAEVLAVADHSAADGRRDRKSVV